MCKLIDESDSDEFETDELETDDLNTDTLESDESETNVPEMVVPIIDTHDPAIVRLIVVVEYITQEKQFHFDIEPFKANHLQDLTVQGTARYKIIVFMQTFFQFILYK